MKGTSQKEGRMLEEIKICIEEEDLEGLRKETAVLYDKLNSCIYSSIMLEQLQDILNEAEEGRWSEAEDLLELLEVDL